MNDTMFLNFTQKMDMKMSSFRTRVDSGKAPLPIFTGVHVRPDVSALKYHGNLSFN